MFIMFCQYKDIFGKVNEGVHSIRIMNIAIVDVILTLVLAYIIQMKLPQYKLYNIFIILIILSIFIHKLFCVKTTLTNLVFD